MRVGFLTDENLLAEDNSEIKKLTEAFEKKGHEIVMLDVRSARFDAHRQLEYPTLKHNESIDFFMNWNPCDEALDKPYFEQLIWLDLRYPTPVPYYAQTITCSKIKMSEFFNAVSGLPIPAAYDVSHNLMRHRLIEDLKSGKGPLVLKPDYGWGGDSVVKVTTPEEASEAMHHFDMSDQRFLVQEFIECGGVDYRAYVVGDRVVAGIKRVPQDGEWRGNFALGATPEAFEFSKAQQGDAVRVMKAAKLNFGAVDLLIDPKTGQHYICEINDCAGTTSIEMCHEGLSLADEVVAMTEAKYGSLQL